MHDYQYSNEYSSNKKPKAPKKKKVKETPPHKETPHAHVPQPRTSQHPYGYTGPTDTHDKLHHHVGRVDRYHSTPVHTEPAKKHSTPVLEYTSIHHHHGHHEAPHEKEPKQEEKAPKEEPEKS